MEEKEISEMSDEELIRQIQKLDLESGEYMDHVLEGLSELNPLNGECPSSLCLSFYSDGDPFHYLSPETRQYVGCHLLECEDCFHDLTLLRELNEAFRNEDLSGKVN